MKELLKKCLVEFIGTFFLVLTVGCCVFSTSNGMIAPLAIGFVLMVMVYAGGYVSGAHYNPAVTLACLVRGAINIKDSAFYWVSQLLAGFVAALLVTKLLATSAPVADFCTCKMAIAEVLFTFALCYVVLHCATTEDTKGNSYYGLAIGSTVLVGAFATSGLCFGAFNPAVAVGLLTFGACAKIIGITVLSNLVGAVLAGLVFKITTK